MDFGNNCNTDLDISSSVAVTGSAKFTDVLIYFIFFPSFVI